MTLEELWKAGENRVAEYLDRKGYTILERNFRCGFGEVDIVALDGDALCFIEVKTRTLVRYGSPCTAVDVKKIEHIKKCAYVYMRRFRRQVSDVRIEIAEVLYLDGKFFIRHLKNVSVSY